jgi:hypothetical protein
MRGHLSGNREALPFSAGGNTAGNDNPCMPAVRLDFGDSFPVGSAELDALEAFLMPQILALLEEKARPDSEAPQSPGRTENREIPRGAACEIFAQEPA